MINNFNKEINIHKEIEDLNLDHLHLEKINNHQDLKIKGICIIEDLFHQDHQNIHNTMSHLVDGTGLHLEEIDLHQE